MEEANFYLIIKNGAIDRSGGNVAPSIGERTKIQMYRISVGKKIV